MPRKPRVEYAGATYHLMCRGDHQEAIYRTDEDCRLFLNTLAETCAQTGWWVHAWVLMGNHYHLLVETPAANLVSGMKWLQGTYTQRFNARHRLRGHLFQGRYKALLVDHGDPHYFQTVAAYIHLNPARAGLIDLEAGSLMDYPWSSYRAYVRVDQRPDWVHTRRLLSVYGQRDNLRGRRAYGREMKRRLLEVKHSKEPWKADEEWDRLRRGWCFGGDEFKREMIGRVEEALEGKALGSHDGEAVRDYHQKDAEQLLSAGLGRLSLDQEDLPRLRKGDPSKRLLAWLIKKNTRMPNRWIADRLHMGHPSNLPQYVKAVEASRDKQTIMRKKTLAKMLK